MNAKEAGQLLAILSAIDNREVDTTKAQGWAWALSDVPYSRGVEAAQRAIRAGVRYIDVQAIRAQLKEMQPQLESDVRSAKARGIIPESWDKHQPLTHELEEQLRTIRAREYEATNDRPEEITGTGTPQDLGQVGRVVPE